VYQAGHFDAPLSIGKEFAVGDDPGTFDQLASLALGELTGHDAERARSAAAASPAASALLERLETVIAAMRAEDSVQPPAVLARRVRDLLRPDPPARPGWIDRATTRMMDLLFDSRLAPALGLRSGAGTMEGFQARFGAGDTEVDLSAAPADSGLRVLGQVDPPPPAGSPVALLGDPGQTREGSTDPRGLFSFAAVPGRYVLAIGRGDDVLMTPLFDLT
jgi:hypothetical protein